ncbi:hypothetical protein IKH83_01695 [Candidatus Saccharibacteria bacterium]|nr:hypothetical protein [Candidatus Saccharibacteria bacterium]
MAEEKQYVTIIISDHPDPELQSQPQPVAQEEKKESAFIDDGISYTLGRISLYGDRIE